MAALRVFSTTALTAVALLSPVTVSAAPEGWDKISTVVVIFAENRSFDNLMGGFPGADGLLDRTRYDATQIDRDGTPLPRLPAIWGGATTKGAERVVSEDKTVGLPNSVFAIDHPAGLGLPLSVHTRDLVHKFYQNQMQIHGGKNDGFAAWSDAGGLVMGTYDGSRLAMWQLAEKYTLADRFFQGAFGGSFLNHFWLACACTPVYPDADKSPAKDLISVVEADGTTLKLAPDSPRSALAGPPKFVADGTLTPDFHAVNTMQPPYQPSGVKPAEGADPAFADPRHPNTLPPQTATNIGDLLTAKGVDWAWYSGAWASTLAGETLHPSPKFQFHHHPFNYFATTAPGTAARAEHVRDGGLSGSAFLADIDAGRLPAVTFYKPQGSLNEHAGYAEVASGDEHVADIVAHLERSPQWRNMLVIVTYDENGGFWDHVAPPKADRWGPGTRIPAIFVSPYARRGFVDHTPYDTTSILRFIAKRFDLPTLPGIAARDAALKANGEPPMGDFSAALDLTR